MATNPLKKKFSIDEKTAVKLVTEMMAIPGKSCQEAKVVAFIQKKLKSAGVPSSAIKVDSAHKKSPYGGETGSLIVKLAGTEKGPRRLLMAHIDTVPLCVGCQPVRKGNLISSKDPKTALGGDDRAGASVVLNTILEIKKHKLNHPPLTLFWPVQEEIGLCGARYVSKGLLGNPKLCFNWDGSDPYSATIGATGDYAIDIQIEGIASHAGAFPEQGVSAISIASLAIADLVENGWHGLVVKGNNVGSSNIGVISGGDATNVVTPHVSLKAEARSHDPKFRKKIVTEIRKAFTQAAKKLKNHKGKTGKIAFVADLKYESFCLDPHCDAVKVAQAAVKSLGRKSQTHIANGGLDANWMTAHGFPTVTLGCGQAEIHTVKEVLHIDKFLDARRIGLSLATGGGTP